MACDTFIKISQKCKRHFVVPQLNEYKPFVEELLDDIHTHISDLEPRQIDTFYEAVGYMIAAQDAPAVRLALIEKLMEIPNKKWNEVVRMASMVRPAVSRFPRVLDVWRSLHGACFTESSLRPT